VEQAHFFFSDTLTWTGEAQELLRQEGVASALAALESAMDPTTLSLDTAPELITEVVKAQGVKKGLVMRSLRAALTGDVHGPDLLQSWVLLAQRGVAVTRLRQAQELAAV
jgi:glutamyl-tRNA synthetase